MSQAAQPRDDRSAALAEAKSELERLIGVHGVKEEVNRLMSFLTIQQERRRHGLRESSQSLHFVFTGNPGTGKTTVARILGKVFFGFGILKTSKVVECDRAKLVGGFMGQTAIKTDEVIRSALDGVLFIDEAYTLAGDAAKYGHGDMYGDEAINTLLKQMEDSRDRLIVIAAGYPAPMETFLKTNPGLQSRFTRFIRFEDYSVAGLCRIFHRFCQDAEYALTPQACADLFLLLAVAYQRRDERFGNARFVRNVYESAVGRQAARLAAVGGDLSKSALMTVDAADIPFDMVAGFDPRSVDLAEGKWEAECPACCKAFTSQNRFLGQRVTCACGQKFTYPWWNPMPGSVRGLAAGVIATPNSGDRRGIVEPVLAAASQKHQESMATGAGASEPFGAARGAGDHDATVVRDWIEYSRSANGSLAAESGFMKEGEAPLAFLKSAVPERFSTWKASAERGNPLAQVLVGHVYSIGVGTAVDATIAASWYRKAAEQGAPLAQYCLGAMYEDGRGVPQDDIEAARWIRKAAEQGGAAFQFILARKYQKGRGVPQSDTEAAVWFRKAAEQGDAGAQLSLGLLNQDGRGVPKSAEEAAAWFRKAAEQGDADAQYFLACAYRAGRGLVQSYPDAVAWFRKAAEQGDAYAQESLGDMYLRGRGVTPSDTEAV